MSNLERKQALAARVELARGKDDSLKTKDQRQNRRKCANCGKSYLGQKNSSTCGDACRQQKHRS